MKNYIYALACICFVCFVTGCKQGDPPANETPLPAARAKACAGHNKYRYSDTYSYAVAPVNGDCYDGSKCEQTKTRMIARAEASATNYCRGFHCADNERESCKGVFRITSWDCSMNSSINAKGQLECRETAVLIGEIDCTCQ